MKDELTGEVLASYASGDGKIRLAWSNPSTKNATGRLVTKEDYQAFTPPKGWRFSLETMAFVEGPNVNFLHTGWYDSPEAAFPAYDPGSDCPCIVCAHPLSMPMITISLANHAPAKRKYSFFFRAHKGCWSDLDEREQHLIESAVIDANQ